MLGRFPFRAHLAQNRVDPTCYVLTLLVKQPKSGDQQKNVFAGRFRSAGRQLQCRTLQLSNYVIGAQPTDAVRTQYLLDFRALQLRRGCRQRRQFEKLPEPWLVNSWTEVSHLRKVAPQQLPQLMTSPHLFLLNILFSARQLAYPDHERRIQSDPMKQRHVGAERIGNNKCIASVVLRTGNCMPVTEAVHLLWIQRIHRKPPLNERFDNCSPRHLDPHGDGFRFTAGESFNVDDELGNAGAAVLNRLSVDYLLPRIQDTNFVALCRPVNSDEVSVLR
jgi:hypothetical protein